MQTTDMPTPSQLQTVSGEKMTNAANTTAKNAGPGRSMEYCPKPGRNTRRCPISAFTVLAAGAPALTGRSAFEVECRVDHRKVGQGLGEVTQQLARLRIEFLGEEPEVVCGLGDAAEEGFRFVTPAHLGQDVDEP